MPLNGDADPAQAFPALVLGAGTGLGAALRFADGERPVLASEIGHAALGAGNALELQVLDKLLQRWPHVDNERVLSGSGLMNLYPCLCELRGVTPVWSSTEALIGAARSGEDALAVETLQVFCAWLGSLAGDAAIAVGARSVYLAGGISAHVQDFLADGRFRERFLNKGVLTEVLRQVPVWRVEHGQLGVLGAAVGTHGSPRTTDRRGRHRAGRALQTGREDGGSQAVPAGRRTGRRHGGLAGRAGAHAGGARVVSTWDFGVPANQAAWKVLAQGGSALDAVEAGARWAESELCNPTVGHCGNPDRDGVLSLDASIMDGDGRCGAVAALVDILHPVSVARKVMENSPHVLLVGEGAQQFAVQQGFERRHLLTPQAEAAWREWLKTEKYQPQINAERRSIPGNSDNHDTIGMLALDARGKLAGACTTSGMAWKLHGRVGDSPIIGAGLYVDNEVGAATASGVGEEMIRNAASLVVELMRQGRSPAQACREAIDRVVRKRPEASRTLQVCFLAMNKQGRGCLRVAPRLRLRRAMDSARTTCATRRRSTRALRREHAADPGDRQQLAGLGAGRAGRRCRPHRTVREPGRGWHHAVVCHHRDCPGTPVDSAVRAGAPRPGDFHYDALETELMLRDIAQCRALGCDGVVIGALDAGRDRSGAVP